MDGNPPADRDVAGLAPRSANALRRGLAARKVLPPDLAQTVRSLRDAFVVELKPTSTLQEILVSELARHAGAMQHAADFEAAVLRAAHKQAGALENLLDTDSVPDPDDRIAAMLISESVERAMRYRRAALIDPAASSRLAGLNMLSGTPKLISNEIESYYSASTANEWQVTCLDCQHSTALNENTLAPSGLACTECLAPLVVNQGRWVSRNPQSMWGDGFSVNHLMVPWLNIQDILERQKTYDPVKFRNECLGLPVCLGDHIITRQEIEACCGDYRFAAALNNVPRTGRSHLVAGIDWGGGSRSGTALVLGYMEPNLTFHIVRMDRWQPYADYEVVVREAAEICRRFQVMWIAADGGGNGQTYNRLLIDKLRCAGRMPHLYGILYSSVDQASERDGVLLRWTVSRSKSIGSLFTRIKKQLIRFPAVTDSGSFLDEFVCELAEYDELQRTVKYTKPENMRDDALHATNYAELLALKLVHGAGSR